MKVLVCAEGTSVIHTRHSSTGSEEITEQHDTPQQAMIGHIQKTGGLHKHQTKICTAQSGWQDWQKCKKDTVKAQEGSSILNST